MSQEIRDSLSRLASNGVSREAVVKRKEIQEQAVPPPVAKAGDVFVQDGVVLEKTAPPVKSRSFRNTRVQRESSPETIIASYQRATPGLEINDLNKINPKSVEMRYNGKPAIASFRAIEDDLEIKELQYRGFDVNFFFKYPGKALGGIFDSVDNAVNFLSEREDFKEIISSVEFDASLGSAVIFSIGNASYFADPYKVVKAKDTTALINHTDLASEKPKPSYGSEFWARGGV